MSRVQNGLVFYDTESCACLHLKNGIVLSGPTHPRLVKEDISFNYAVILFEKRTVEIDTGRAGFNQAFPR